MTRILSTLLAAGLFSTSALAQVTVTDPWVRATVPNQKASGAFMRVQSAQAARLVGVSTPVAGRAELHEMAMENNTMRMRQVDAIDLPAGKAVNLASGGYHVMFFDLKRQLKEGETVPVTLLVQDGAKKNSSVTVEARVKPLTFVAPKTGHGH
ncbi:MULTISPECIES: copper chaperone PCu(A)C [unclassified Massilia]|uniref:copper chaperone PCu(A)C n=1 Tax=unclassified Massilia TaxID=2609279 RepID=UPI00177D9375|nr:MULTISPECIES: copper chaperone PCu(A)C [unclassified Massilia]MBD8532186.1 copper chaperone PCu(A)C [Massilia sp. CFBP 13647]MBD8675556.1 copper chaperone PCu(A)C [Massilia sp. CFBP 13721]